MTSLSSDKANTKNLRNINYRVYSFKWQFSFLVITSIVIYYNYFQTLFHQVR